MIIFSSKRNKYYSLIYLFIEVYNKKYKEIMITLSLSNDKPLLL